MSPPRRSPVRGPARAGRGSRVRRREARPRSRTNCRPSKSPTKYWLPEPPAGAPGLRFTISTHRVSWRAPSTGSGNRSGHSQMPSVAPAGPKSAEVRPGLQVARRVEADLPLLRPGHDHHPALARRVPEHLRVAEVLLPDVEHRIAGVLRPRPAAIVAVGDMLVLQRPLRVVPGVEGHERRPAVAGRTRCCFFQSTTALPEKIITPFSSARASGRCCQWTRSGLTAWPQLMWPHLSPNGLYW